MADRVLLAVTGEHQRRRPATVREPAHDGAAPAESSPLAGTTDHPAGEDPSHLRSHVPQASAPPVPPTLLATDPETDVHRVRIHRAVLAILQTLAGLYGVFPTTRSR
ncbi:hypothetical protein ACZ91_45455 [Streptomyces regensis]|nr:hypothetical protein ACZ91_45455 [Streptomyces regensis]KOG74345.1 hypothetical protein ADK77_05995 [Streptomyces antibioticus]